MSLRRKTLLLIGLSLVGLILLLYTVSRFILLDSFKRLEDEDAHQRLQALTRALDDDLAGLGTLASDWGVWDDTYRFIRDGNDDYIASNLLPDTFTTLQLNLILMINERGETVYAQSFDLQTGEEEPVSFSINRHVSADSPLRNLDAQSPITGVVMLPEGPLLVAAQPILTSEGEGPAGGILIFGRYLEADQIEIADYSVTLAAYDTTDANFEAARLNLSDAAPFFIQPLNDKMLAAYTLVDDLYGNPSVILREALPRTIFQQGQTSLSYLLLSLAAVGLVSGLLTLGLVERVVLSRLAKLNASVRGIGTSRDVSARVVIMGDDELSSLASAINGMLQALTQSQDNLHQLNAELEGRVAARTAELGQKNVLLQAILDTMGEGVIYTTDGHIHYANQALADMTGYELEELVGQPDTLLQTETASQQQAWLITARLADQALERGDINLRRKDNSRLSVAVTATRLKLPGSQEFGRVAIVRDITQAKALQDWQKRFISSASHELRTPITNLTTRLYLIRKQPEKMEDHLAVLDYISERLKRLIEDLLDVSRFQQGMIPLNREDVVLQTLLSEVVKIQEPEAEQKKISVKTDFEPLPLHALADPNRIVQAVTNLVTNALHYTPEGGLVTVRLIGETGHALICVCDNGEGIAPEHLCNVFQPFYRGGQSGKNGGTGLGLTITKEIVEMHGGTVTVESEVGKGSTFTIKLPLVSEIPQNAPLVGEKAH